MTDQEPQNTLRGDILEEANILIHGDRQAQYGPPDENFKNIADLWNIRFKHLLAEGAYFKPSDIAMAMVLLKIGRDMQGYKRDSAVDGVGYLALYAEMSDAELHDFNDTLDRSTPYESR